MTTFIVDGIFPAILSLPATTFSGTVDITGGVLDAMDITVTGVASHFTVLDAPSGIGMLAGTTPGSTPLSTDFITLSFGPIPGPYLMDFQQAQFYGGSATHSTHNFITGITTVTYYGFAPQGTICPESGCLPFPPPPGVPGPVAGAGLGSIVVCLFLWRFLKNKFAETY
jgi:hypothetical protein